MTNLDLFARQGLIASLQSLISESGYQLDFKKLKIRGTGLGGYIGPSQDPQGTLFGRTCVAEMKLTTKLLSEAALAQTVDQLLNDLFGRVRSELVAVGIHKMDLVQMDDPLKKGQKWSRTLHFELTFEYIHKPNDGADMIDTIDIQPMNTQAHPIEENRLDSPFNIT